MKLMKKIIPIITVLIVAVFLNNCKKEDLLRPTEEEYIIGDDTVTISSNAVIVTTQTENVLQQVTENQLTFSSETQELEQLENGNILVGGISENAPDGYLRKVVNITKSGGQIIVNTEQAEITDVIKDCDFSIKRVVTTNDILNKKKSAKSSKFEGEIDVVLFDHDGNYDTDNDQVKITGTYSIEPEIIFDLKIREYTLQNFKFGLKFTKELEIQAKAKVQFDLLKKETTLATIPLSSIAFFVGTVPIVITPQLVIKVGIDGSLSAEITVTKTETTTDENYIQYANGSWSTEKTREENTTFEPVKFTFEADAKAFIKTAFELKFYGMDAFKSSIVVENYLKMNSILSITGNERIFDWEIASGIKSTAEVDITIFENSTANFSATIFDEKHVFTEGEVIYVKDFDGNWYNTVEIGNQRWMSENMKSTHYSNGYTITGAYAYDNDESNVETYGRLYTWNATMNGAVSSNSNPSGVQGV